MTIDLVVVGGVIGSLLIGLVGWLARRQIERLERDLEEERKARVQDKHDLRNDINAVGQRVTAFQLDVARECVNHERMGAALEPFLARLGEIRSDIKELFTRLDRKQDKAHLG